jgi:hypothetical protein
MHKHLHLISGTTFDEFGFLQFTAVYEPFFFSNVNEFSQVQIKIVRIHRMSLKKNYPLVKLLQLKETKPRNSVGKY